MMPNVFKTLHIILLDRQERPTLREVTVEEHFNYLNYSSTLEVVTATLDRSQRHVGEGSCHFLKMNRIQSKGALCYIH